ncbi:uncharacterized protein NPIL_649091, partial [Nephila pilipes]
HTDTASPATIEESTKVTPVQETKIKTEGEKTEFTTKESEDDTPIATLAIQNHTIYSTSTSTITMSDSSKVTEFTLTTLPTFKSTEVEFDIESTDQELTSKTILVSSTVEPSDLELKSTVSTTEEPIDKEVKFTFSEQTVSVSEQSETTIKDHSLTESTSKQPETLATEHISESTSVSSKPIDKLETKIDFVSVTTESTDFASESTAVDLETDTKTETKGSTVFDLSEVSDADELKTTQKTKLEDVSTPIEVTTLFIKESPTSLGPDIQKIGTTTSEEIKLTSATSLDESDITKVVTLDANETDLASEISTPEDKFSKDVFKTTPSLPEIVEPKVTTTGTSTESHIITEASEITQKETEETPGISILDRVKPTTEEDFIDLSSTLKPTTFSKEFTLGGKVTTDHDEIEEVTESPEISTIFSSVKEATKVEQTTVKKEEETQATAFTYITSPTEKPIDELSTISKLTSSSDAATESVTAIGETTLHSTIIPENEIQKLTTEHEKYSTTSKFFETSELSTLLEETEVESDETTKLDATSFDKAITSDSIDTEQTLITASPKVTTEKEESTFTLEIKDTSGEIISDDRTSVTTEQKHFTTQPVTISEKDSFTTIPAEKKEMKTSVLTTESVSSEKATTSSSVSTFQKETPETFIKDIEEETTSISTEEGDKISVLPTDAESEVTGAHETVQSLSTSTSESDEKEDTFTASTRYAETSETKDVEQKTKITESEDVDQKTKVTVTTAKTTFKTPEETTEITDAETEASKMAESTTVKVMTASDEVETPEKISTTSEERFATEKIEKLPTEGTKIEDLSTEEPTSILTSGTPDSKEIISTTKTEATHVPIREFAVTTPEAKISEDTLDAQTHFTLVTDATSKVHEIDLDATSTFSINVTEAVQDVSETTGSTAEIDAITTQTDSSDKIFVTHSALEPMTTNLFEHSEDEKSTTATSTEESELVRFTSSALDAEETKKTKPDYKDEITTPIPKDLSVLSTRSTTLESDKTTLKESSTIEIKEATVPSIASSTIISESDFTEESKLSPTTIDAIKTTEVSTSSIPSFSETSEQIKTDAFKTTIIESHRMTDTPVLSSEEDTKISEHVKVSTTKITTESEKSTSESLPSESFKEEYLTTLGYAEETITSILPKISLGITDTVTDKETFLPSDFEESKSTQENIIVTTGSTFELVDTTTQKRISETKATVPVDLDASDKEKKQTTVTETVTTPTSTEIKITHGQIFTDRETEVTSTDITSIESHFDEEHATTKEVSKPEIKLTTEILKSHDVTDEPKIASTSDFKTDTSSEISKFDQKEVSTPSVLDAETSTKLEDVLGVKEHAEKSKTTITEPFTTESKDLSKTEVTIVLEDTILSNRTFGIDSMIVAQSTTPIRDTTTESVSTVKDITTTAFSDTHGISKEISNTTDSNTHSSVDVTIFRRVTEPEVTETATKIISTDSSTLASTKTEETPHTTDSDSEGQPATVTDISETESDQSTLEEKIFKTTPSAPSEETFEDKTSPSETPIELTSTELPQEEAKLTETTQAKVTFEDLDKSTVIKESPLTESSAETTVTETVLKELSTAIDSKTTIKKEEEETHTPEILTEGISIDYSTEFTTVKTSEITDSTPKEVTEKEIKASTESLEKTTTEIHLTPEELKITDTTTQILEKSTLIKSTETSLEGEVTSLPLSTTEVSETSKTFEDKLITLDEHKTTLVTLKEKQEDTVGTDKIGFTEPTSESKTTIVMENITLSPVESHTSELPFSVDHSETSENIMKTTSPSGEIFTDKTVSFEVKIETTQESITTPFREEFDDQKKLFTDKTETSISPVLTSTKTSEISIPEVTVKDDLRTHTGEESATSQETESPQISTEFTTPVSEITVKTFATSTVSDKKEISTDITVQDVKEKHKTSPLFDDSLVTLHTGIKMTAEPIALVTESTSSTATTTAEAVTESSTFVQDKGSTTIIDELESKSTTAKETEEDTGSAEESECVVDGTFYGDGEAIVTVEPCEKCHCSSGEIVCFKIICKVPKSGCVPETVKTDECCPTSYKCPTDVDSVENATFTGSPVLTEKDLSTPIPISFMFSTTPASISATILVSKTEDGAEKKNISTQTETALTTSNEESPIILDDTEGKDNETTLKTISDISQPAVGTTEKSLDISESAFSSEITITTSESSSSTITSLSSETAHDISRVKPTESSISDFTSEKHLFDITAKSTDVDKVKDFETTATVYETPSQELSSETTFITESRQPSTFTLEAEKTTTISSVTDEKKSKETASEISMTPTSDSSISTTAVKGTIAAESKITTEEISFDTSQSESTKFFEVSTKEAGQGTTDTISVRIGTEASVSKSETDHITEKSSALDEKEKSEVTSPMPESSTFLISSASTSSTFSERDTEATEMESDVTGKETLSVTASKTTDIEKVKGADTTISVDDMSTDSKITEIVRDVTEPTVFISDSDQFSTAEDVTEGKATTSESDLFSLSSTSIIEDQKEETVTIKTGVTPDIPFKSDIKTTLSEEKTTEKKSTLSQESVPFSESTKPSIFETETDRITTASFTEDKISKTETSSVFESSTFTTLVPTTEEKSVESSTKLEIGISSKDISFETTTKSIGTNETQDIETVTSDEKVSIDKSTEVTLISHATDSSPPTFEAVNLIVTSAKADEEIKSEATSTSLESRLTTISFPVSETTLVDKKANTVEEIESESTTEPISKTTSKFLETGKNTEQTLSEDKISTESEIKKTTSIIESTESSVFKIETDSVSKASSLDDTSKIETFPVSETTLADKKSETVEEIESDSTTELLLKTTHKPVEIGKDTEKTLPESEISTDTEIKKTTLIFETTEPSVFKTETDKTSSRDEETSKIETTSQPSEKITYTTVSLSSEPTTKKSVITVGKDLESTESTLMSNITEPSRSEPDVTFTASESTISTTSSTSTLSAKEVGTTTEEKSLTETTHESVKTDKDIGITISEEKVSDAEKSELTTLILQSTEPTSFKIETDFTTELPSVEDEVTKSKTVSPILESSSSTIISIASTPQADEESTETSTTAESDVSEKEISSESITEFSDIDKIKGFETTTSTEKISAEKTAEGALASKEMSVFTQVAITSTIAPEKVEGEIKSETFTTPESKISTVSSGPESTTVDKLFKTTPQFVETDKDTEQTFPDDKISTESEIKKATLIIETTEPSVFKTETVSVTKPSSIEDEIFKTGTASQSSETSTFTTVSVSTAPTTEERDADIATEEESNISFETTKSTDIHEFQDFETTISTEKASSEKDVKGTSQSDLTVSTESTVKPVTLAVTSKIDEGIRDESTLSTITTTSISADKEEKTTEKIKPETTEKIKSEMTTELLPEITTGLLEIAKDANKTLSEEILSTEDDSKKTTSVTERIETPSTSFEEIKSNTTTLSSETVTISSDTESTFGFSPDLLKTTDSEKLDSTSTKKVELKTTMQATEETDKIKPVTTPTEISDLLKFPDATTSESEETFKTLESSTAVPVKLPKLDDVVTSTSGTTAEEFSTEKLTTILEKTSISTESKAIDEQTTTVHAEEASQSKESTEFVSVSISTDYTEAPKSGAETTTISSIGDLSTTESKITEEIKFTSPVFLSKSSVSPSTFPTKSDQSTIQSLEDSSSKDITYITSDEIGSSESVESFTETIQINQTVVSLSKERTPIFEDEHVTDARQTIKVDIPEETVPTQKLFSTTEGLQKLETTHQPKLIYRSDQTKYTDEVFNFVSTRFTDVTKEIQPIEDVVETKTQETFVSDDIEASTKFISIQTTPSFIITDKTEKHSVTGFTPTEFSVTTGEETAVTDELISSISSETLETGSKEAFTTKRPDIKSLDEVTDTDVTFENETTTEDSDAHPEDKLTSKISETATSSSLIESGTLGFTKEESHKPEIETKIPEIHLFTEVMEAESPKSVTMKPTTKLESSTPEIETETPEDKFLTDITEVEPSLSQTLKPMSTIFPEEVSTPETKTKQPEAKLLTEMTEVELPLSQTSKSTIMEPTSTERLSTTETETKIPKTELLTDIIEVEPPVKQTSKPITIGFTTELSTPETKTKVPEAKLLTEVTEITSSQSQSTSSVDIVEENVTHPTSTRVEDIPTHSPEIKYTTNDELETISGKKIITEKGETTSITEKESLSTESIMEDADTIKPKEVSEMDFSLSTTSIEGKPTLAYEITSVKEAEDISTKAIFPEDIDKSTEATAPTQFAKDNVSSQTTPTVPFISSSSFDSELSLTTKISSFTTVADIQPESVSTANASSVTNESEIEAKISTITPLIKLDLSSTISSLITTTVEELSTSLKDIKSTQIVTEEPTTTKDSEIMTTASKPITEKDTQMPLLFKTTLTPTTLTDDERKSTLFKTTYYSSSEGTEPSSKEVTTEETTEKIESSLEAEVSEQTTLKDAHLSTEQSIQTTAEKVVPPKSTEMPTKAYKAIETTPLSLMTTLPPEAENITAETEDEYLLDDGACIFEGQIYQSAEQIVRADPCEFCFCFRGDIICLQQSCPPPAPNCHRTMINGYCCPRYDCPVLVTSRNITSLTRRKGVQPIIIQRRIDKRAVRESIEVKGCQINGTFYEVGSTVSKASGPCLHCMCEEGGNMRCDPQKCKPEPPLMLKMNNSFFRTR